MRTDRIYQFMDLCGIHVYVFITVHKSLIRNSAYF